MDRDPEARVKEVKVKVAAPVCPTLPPEIAPGTDLHPCAFEGLTVTPYIVEGASGRRARLGYSFRSTGVVPQGKALAGPVSSASGATGSGRSGGQASSGGPGDGKAA